MATSNHRIRFPRILLAAALPTLFVMATHAQDPPTRVADLNYINNNVSMQPAGAEDWSPAVVNRPFTTGDYLWADENSSAELHLNNAVLRIGPETSLGFLNLDDRVAQLRFAQGELILHVRHLEEDESFEVDTPNAAVTILREGEYRFQANPDTATTLVVVRNGEAEVTGGGQAFTVHAGNSAQLTGSDQLAFDVQYAPPTDWFERWADDRQLNESSRRSAQYLPPDVIGYEDLDNHGTWRETPEYGAVWYPTVDASWAPYRYGHWAWIEPWGWTWVDDAPWGFAPFHYGRWAYINGGWGWIPGPVAIVGGRRPVARAVWAPALVAFIGGGGWGVSLSLGGPAVGWVPLGPGEVYTPAYHVSHDYFRTVNVSNTTVINNVNITNVYNTVYVNKTVTNVAFNPRYTNMMAPNAVTAMRQNEFASGRPVRGAGIAITRDQAVQLHATSVMVAPAVAPVRQALAPVAGRGPVFHPPARAVNVPVVARRTPPPPPVSFVAKQAILQQNAGRPLNVQAVREAAPQRPVMAPPVRVAPPARQVTPPVRPTQPVMPDRSPNTPNVPNQPVYRPPQNQPAPESAPATRPVPTYRPEQTPPARPAPTYRPPEATQPPRPAPTYRPEQTPPPKPQPVQPTRNQGAEKTKVEPNAKPKEDSGKPQKKHEKPKDNREPS
ncbi:MAG TPA: DUF6600 domain-containing protein [Bryobacteraceae bacterium]|nr:DUF6600 domain-containing protein [Bryobacteraceae bacterium]